MKNLLDAKEACWALTDSLQVSYVTNSHLVIATTQIKQTKKQDKFKRSIIFMKVNIAGK